ncbi:PPW family C-terminal domain-containing PPE protein [Candidatus Mycobacterium methanotrophicum]|uniref:PPW family C-terminal domain-containing PPE protein n=1 Tax=Candidatus Mycobacterium methanotrophicum TaxID=2943498 RepID=UPI003511480C
MRDRTDEFADIDGGFARGVQSERPPVLASDRGTGPVGFAGTAHKDTAAPVVGLATLTSNGFNGGPTMPMVPGTWSETAGGEGEGDQGIS